MQNKLYLIILSSIIMAVQVTATELNDCLEMFCPYGCDPHNPKTEAPRCCREDEKLIDGHCGCEFEICGNKCCAEGEICEADGTCQMYSPCTIAMRQAGFTDIKKYEVVDNNITWKDTTRASHTLTWGSCKVNGSNFTKTSSWPGDLTIQTAVNLKGCNLILKGKLSVKTGGALIVDNIETGFLYNNGSITANNITATGVENHDSMTVSGEIKADNASQTGAIYNCKGANMTARRIHGRTSSVNVWDNAYSGLTQCDNASPYCKSYKWTALICDFCNWGSVKGTVDKRAKGCLCPGGEGSTWDCCNCDSDIVGCGDGHITEKCPDGYYMTTQKICCPNGSEYMNGICCAKDKHNDNGICCSANYHNSEGYCCPNGTEYTGGICCPEGQHSENGYCVSEDGQPTVGPTDPDDGGNCGGITCPSGYHNDNGHCCKNGSHYDVSLCCQDGFHYSSGYCCKNGSEYSKGICCPSGYTNDGGLCCPSGYHKSSGGKTCCPAGYDDSNNSLHCCQIGYEYMPSPTNPTVSVCCPKHGPCITAGEV